MRHLAVLLLAAILPAQEEQSTSMAQRIDAALTRSGFSGVITVTEGGKTLFHRAYGSASLELQVANGESTKFRIGSVTKPFTAMAVLLLRDRGKLTLADPLGKHLEALPAHWAKLSIHQCLTHTSGLMHSWSLAGFREEMAVQRSLEETLARFHDQPLESEPGTRFRYSGVGYFLLARLIEELSGKRYAAFMAKEIFKPLGMKHTGADIPGPILPGRATGYLQPQRGGPRRAPPIHMPILTGGGNLYSTTRDLARWGEAIRQRELLSAESYQLWFRPVRNGYAYGWRVEKRFGQDLIWHTGGLPGFATYAAHAPRLGRFVAITSNLVGPDTRRAALTALSLALRR